AVVVAGTADAHLLDSLAGQPFLGRLTSLGLSYSALGPEEVHVLTASPFLGGLRSLSLDGDEALEDDGVGVLAGCPGLAGLESLSLFDAGLSAEGVRALASSPHLRRLKVLDLAENFTGPRAAAALEELYLDWNRIGDKGAKALAASPW